MGLDPVTLGLASLAGGVIQGNVARDTAGKQMGAIQNKFDSAKGLYDTSIASYDPYQQAGTKAMQSYQDLLNGGSFGNNPQFQYQQQLLNQRLAKSRQSTSASAQSVYSQPLISQGYQSALGNLMPLIQQGYNATGAQAGLRGNLANMYTGLGQSEANAIGAAMPRYDQMIGGAIGTMTGAANTMGQNNYMNALASYYTNNSGNNQTPSMLFPQGYQAQSMSAQPYGPVNKTTNWGW